MIHRYIIYKVLNIRSIILVLFFLTSLEPVQSWEIGGENINNLRYADYTIPMAESEEELKSLLMTVKEKSEKLA